MRAGQLKLFFSLADYSFMPGDRAEIRMLCAELVDVRWRDKSGRGRKGTAILEDISASGACLQFDAPIPVTSVVRISLPKGVLQGIVRYCVYREIGYFVGLQFEPDCKWSRRAYEPKHLLDLQRLVARSIRSAAKRIPKAVVQ